MITSIILYFENKKFKHRIISFLMYAWIFFGLYCFTAVLAYLFLNQILYRFSFVLLLVTAIFFTLSLDLFIDYSYDAKKMILLGVIICGTIIALLNPESTYQTYIFPPGYDTFLNERQLHFSLIFLSIFTCLLFFNYCLQIFLKSPPELRKVTIWTLFGGFIFGIISPIIYAFRLLQNFPGSMNIGVDGERKSVLGELH